MITEEAQVMISGRCLERFVMITEEAQVMISGRCLERFVMITLSLFQRSVEAHL
ncbi:hypothetical protein ACRERI_01725 [Methanothermobacter thermautotrophicus]|uniref:hypothetical protein n=1 Tax=Methanothermobacter thermautotrophicus TaxID=145262 RepID=UPI003D8000E6